MSLINCRVVLVRPRIAANLGATARAMRNFGLRDLVLVAPEANPADREARKLSTHGETILESARIVGEFGDAVGECIFVAGTSARIGGLFRDHSCDSPAAVLPRLVTAFPDGPAALVFGPEPSGLTNDEVARCHALIHIDADPEYPALNLAQSVAICLYELRKAWLQSVMQLRPPEPAATFAEQEQMFVHLRAALERIHFLYGDKADALMHAIRHLVGKASPTAMEVKLLHGLARQIEWIAANNPDTPAIE